MKQISRLINPIIPVLVFGAAMALYVATLAPSVVPGDPGEYQFIPHVLGIAHPPGYAFYTLLAKAWTTLARIGSVAYRSNLLSAAAGAWTTVTAYATVKLLWKPGPNTQPSGRPEGAPPSGRLEGAPYPIPQYPISIPSSLLIPIPALFTALVLATSVDLWQHSLHANSHIVSAALSATTLYSGLRWWAAGRDRWLYAFAFLAALGVTQHPLLALGAPAYVIFVLAVRPGLLRDSRRLAGIVLAVLLGLSVFLYLPLRAGATPFGPSPNLDAIVGHATARGIRGNLFHFGLADQPVRLRVYWELLRLQFALPTLLLSLLGLIWLAWRRPRPFILLALFYAVNLAFTINTVQDVMAYLLLPFTTTAVLAGAGVLALLDLGARMVPHRPWGVVAALGLTLLLAVGPVMAAADRTPRVSLRDYRLADAYIQAVFDQFAGRGEGAVLLAPWEGITPLEYAQHVEGRRLDPADVQVVFVASGTANPWVEFVWRYIEAGPIYLADYRPQVAAAGFRLRPVGDWPLFKLEPPPATSPPPMGHSLDLWAGDAIQLLGWDLDRTALQTGETAYLTLYMRTDRPLADYYMPYLQLGDRLYRWTTDSRLNTPWWEPGEIIVERYPITVPFGTPPGDYPLALGVSNVSQGQDLPLSNGATTITLPLTLHVQAAAITPPDAVLSAALANLDSRIALLGATASSRGHAVSAPWSEPLLVRPGDHIQVWLDWRALTAVDAPYTVFVHLIDAAGRPWAQHDYTPMGGAFPTFLWIPRWIEGQEVSDPYQLSLPPDAPPGDYWIEVGMYGMTSLRRVYLFDRQGDLAGDRYILGPVRIQTP
jgi:hypothetical protein